MAIYLVIYLNVKADEVAAAVVFIDAKCGMHGFYFCVGNRL